MFSRFAHSLEGFSRRIVKPRRGAGVAVSALLVLAAGGYGVIRGDHIATFFSRLADARDATASAAGFGLQSVAISGRKAMSEAEVLAIAGISERSSLPFLDVMAAKAALESNPRIARASVRKLYPGELQISIDERQPFALWQNAGKVSVIAADGAVLGPYDARANATLPLVVGPGAASRAQEFLTAIERFPALRGEMRAAVLVAERRWNLRLKNGLDIRLPETELAEALTRLTALDAERKLLTRDITSVDLRLPDRVSVRLSDEAAAARENTLKEKKAKKKGGDA